MKGKKAEIRCGEEDGGGGVRGIGGGLREEG